MSVDIKAIKSHVNNFNFQRTYTTLSAPNRSIHQRTLPLESYKTVGGRVCSCDTGEMLPSMENGSMLF